MTKSDIRAEAADLLACLASQPGDGPWPAWTTRTCPGHWAPGTRRLASDTVCHIVDSCWRDEYAEAEARLREVTP